MRFYLFLLLLCCNLPATAQNARVRQAQARYAAPLHQALATAGCRQANVRLYLRAFKQEQILEAWVAAPGQPYTLLRSYPFCASSGTLGPKRQSGDMQIPEGRYRVDRWNPSSNFHLSLGINYPTPAERAAAHKLGLDPGGDIFIHGGCATIGCIPITDESIQELYLLATWARAAGGRIAVDIFPARLDDIILRSLHTHPAATPEVLALWRSLCSVYQQFEASRLLP